MEQLEQRVLPAVTAFNGGTLTIDFSTVNETINVFNNGTNISVSSANGVTGTSQFATNTVTRIVVDDPGNAAGQTFRFSGSADFSLPGGLDIAGPERVQVARQVGTGAADLTIVANEQIAFNSSLTTTDGNILLKANEQGTGTGQFIAIDAFGGSATATGSGTVTLLGRGGDGNSNIDAGVRVVQGSLISGRTTSVTGIGGPSTGNANYGVYVSGIGSTISSTGGAVLVDGTGGGIGSSSNNYGVTVVFGGTVSAGGTGSVTVNAVGGNAAGSGTSNNGLQMFSDSASGPAQITSSGGTVSINATGTSNSAAMSIGSMSVIGTGNNAPLDITADSIALITGVTPAGINSGTGKTSIFTKSAGTQVNFGVNDTLSGALTLGLTAAEMNLITAGTLVIGNGTTGNIRVSTAIAPANVTQLELVSGGQILDNNATGVDITVIRLGLTAATGIGVANALETAVSNLEGATATGGILVSNSGALTVGGVNSTLSGLDVTGASGGIQIDNTGSVNVSEKVTAPGSILLSANSAGADFTVTADVGAVRSTTGAVTVMAARDLYAGFNGNTGDIRSDIALATLSAGRDIVISSGTFVQGASVSASAGHDFSVLDSSLFNAIGNSATASVTTGNGGTITIDSSNSGNRRGIATSNGAINLTTDNLIVGPLGDINAGNSPGITVKTATDGRTVSLGSAGAGLRIDDMAFNAFNTSGTITIGRRETGAGANSSSDITFTSAIQLADNSTVPAALQLLTGGSVFDTTATGQFAATVAGFDVVANGNIGALGSPVKIAAATLATDTSTSNGAQYLSEKDSVAIGTADLNAGTGTINLNSGTFVMSAGQGIVGNVVVGSGVTLAGTGTIVGDVSGAGNVAPGNSPGVITITGDFTPTGTISFEVNAPAVTPGTDYDQIVVSGTVDLSGATIAVPTGAAGAVSTNQIVTLIQNNSASPITPSVSYADGAVVTISGNAYRIFYNGGDGNDLVLVAESPATTVYVDVGFLENPGQVIADADAGTNGDQSAIFGVTAFKTLAAALAAVTSGGTVIVNTGSYPETVTVSGTRSLKIGGSDAAQSVEIDSLATVSGTTVTLAGTSILIVGNSTNVTIAGTITGGGSLVKQGAGMVTLSNTNDYAGTTTVTSGTLRVTANNGLGTAAGGTNVGPSGTLDLRNVNYSAQEPVGLQGGTLANSSGVTTFAGTVTMTATGNFTTTSSVLDLEGAIVGGQVVQKNGAGILEISNVGNVFARATITGGTLRLGASGVFPDIADLANFGLFDVNGFNETLDSMGGSGSITNSQSTPVTLTLGAGNNNSGSSQVGSIAGAISIVKIGTGRQLLGSGVSSYTGTVTIDGGTLAVSSEVSSPATQALGSASAGTTINAAGTLEFRDVLYALAEPITVNGGTIRSTGGLSTFGGPITLANSSTTINTGTNSTLTLNGVIEGDQGLNKTGSGTLLLTANNTFSGGTNINSGTLLVGGSLNVSSAVTVNNTGTLGGNGTINSTVLVNSGGKLSPGNAVGTLNTGSVTLSSGSTFVVEINGDTSGTFDQLNVTGAVDLTGSSLNASGAIESSVGQEVVIINNDGTDPVVGTFNGLVEGAIVVVNGLTFRISYQGGSEGNDVVLTQIEPPNDVSVTMTDDQIKPVPGGTITYTITVANAGPFAADETLLTDNFPTAITTVSWTSVAAGGATGNTASGSGDLAEVLTLPAGASVTYTVVANISSAASGTLINTATVSQAGDTDSSNDSATDTDYLDNPVSITKISDASEPGSHGKFRVTQGSVAALDTIVTYSVTGSATNGADFTALSGSVTIPAGATSADIDVLVVDDQIVEAAETVTVTLTGFTQAGPGVILDSIPANLVASLNLADNDTNTLSISAPIITDTNVDQVVTFTITSPRAVAGGFDVAITTANGTAGAADYALITTLVHFAGTVGETQPVSVTIKGDAIVEANETFDVILGAVSNTTSGQQAAITTGASATGVIVNSQSSVVTISNATVTESNTDQIVTFTVTSSNAVQGGFDLAVSNLNITASSSDSSLLTSSLHFTGTSGETQQVSVIIRGDTVVEADETFGITLGPVSGTTGVATNAIDLSNSTATGSILNDDSSALSISAPLITETNSDQQVTFTVTSANSVPGGFDVAVTSANGTAGSNDFELITTSLHFIGVAGESHLVSVRIKGDTIVEANETFSVQLGTISGTSGTQAAAIVTGASATATINNDDTNTLMISGNPVVTETNVDQSLLVTVTSPNAVEGGFDLTIHTVDGTADSNDYALVTTTLHFSGAAGETVTVSILGDQIVEGDETFQVELGAVSGTTATQLAAITSGASTEVTINNDDTTTLSISSPIVIEGSNGTTTMTFEVISSHAVQGGFTVDFDVADISTSGTDYLLGSTSPLVFVGTASEVQTITISVVGDLVSESDETFSVTLGSVTPVAQVSAANIITGAVGVGTIRDDDAVTFTISDVTVQENDGTLVFNLIADKTLDIDVTIDVTFSNGSATGGADFGNAVQSITFLAGQTVKQVTVTILDDQIVETAEDFVASLSTTTPLNGRTLNLSDTATGTITDNDTATFTINNVEASEGAGTLVFNLVTDKPLDIDVTVDVTFTHGTAAAGDYSSTTQQITFLAGQTSQQFSVSIVDDNIVEGSESFAVALSTSTPLGGRSVDLSDTATGTITDNDTATFTINNVEASEGGGALVFYLVTDKPLDIDVTVDVTFTHGTATTGDYSSTTQKITFLAGQTSQQFSVSIVDDNIVEGSESFAVALSTSTPLGGRSVDLSDTATGTITDNDTATFTINNVEASEGAGTLVFNLVTDKPLDIDVTVDVTFTHGTATGGDYSSTTQKITFLAGQTSQQVSVAIVDDNIVEATEFFTVGLGTATPLDGRSVDLSDTGIGAVRDNDTATFTINDVTVSESAGVLVFDLTLDQPLDIDVTVEVTFTNATATAGDYSGMTQQIKFLAGQTSQQVSVAVVDDNIVEGSESLAVALSTTTPLGGSSVDLSDTATGTITDNDTAKFTINNLEASEGAGALVFSLVTDKPLDIDVTVSVTFTNGTAAAGDYSGTTQQITFLAGQTSQLVTVAVTNDNVVEAAEFFILGLGTPTSLGGRSVDLSDTGIGTIRDNDTATFTINDVTSAESAGVLVFDVTLDQPLDIDVSIEVTFTNGAATAGDYSGTTQQVTFLAGQTSKQVSVAVVDDHIVEASESFGVALSTTTPLGGRSVDLSDTATGTITDNDTATFTINDVTVSESTGAMVFNLALDKPLDIDISIDVTFTPGTATAGDFSSTTQQITFLAGQTSQQVSVAVVDDHLVEASESFGVALSTTTPLGGRSVDVSDTAIGTITDNDTATFTINDVMVSEGTGGLVFDLAIDNPLDIDVTVNVTFTHGTAGGGDYSSATQQVTFLAGQTSRQISVAVADDNIVEASESFAVALSTTTPLGGRNVDLSDTGTGTIVDNDASHFTIDDVSVSEGDGTLHFNIVTDNPLDIDVTITVTFSSGSAIGGTDYVSTTQQITFLAGETAKAVTVAIHDDTVVEATETFSAMISTATVLGGRTVLATDTATGTIVDNDTAVVSVVKLQDGAESTVVTHGKFRISQSSVSSTDTVVNYTVTGTATSGAGNDYTALSGTATIPAGQTEVEIDLQVLNDNLVESTETVILTLLSSGVHDADITFSVTPATVNITDNDQPTITSAATATVIENTSMSTVVLDVNVDESLLAAGHSLTYSLTGPDAAQFSINSSTGEITFVAVPDFETPADDDADNVYQVTVIVTADTLPARVATQDLTITVTPENDVSPVFTNSSPSFNLAENATVGTVVGSVTATDGDVPSQTLTYSIVSGNENGTFAINPVNGQITVADSTLLNFESSNSFSLTVRVTDNTPTARTAEAIVVVNLTDVFEGPLITIPNPTGTYYIGKSRALISPDSTFSYENLVDPNYNGSKLTVSIVNGRSKRDRLSIFSKGDGEGQIHTQGRKVFIGDTQIGTFTGGRGRKPDLVVTLNDQADTAAVGKLLRRLNFTAQDNVGANRTINIQLTNVGEVDSNVAIRVIAVVL